MALRHAEIEKDEGRAGPFLQKGEQGGPVGGRRDPVALAVEKIGQFLAETDIVIGYDDERCTAAGALCREGRAWADSHGWTLGHSSLPTL